MQQDRHATAAGLRALLQRLTVLLVCLGLAGVSLAAAGGKKAGDPGAAVLAAAKTHLKNTYVWGATGPSTWDCSGLTSTLWREVGGVKAIPRTAHEQQAWAVPLPIEQVRPGDLVFFGDPVTHVGIIERRTKSKAGVVGAVMVDASSSNKGVVERPVWTTGVVRFGRVPRKGMVPVQPWTPPAPVSVAPVTPALPAAIITPLGKGLRAIKGLPAKDLPSSRLGAKLVGATRLYLGNKTLSDVNLVRNAWHRVGGIVLPGSRAGLLSQATAVPLSDARPGDLVVYGPPASHLGIYVGKGLMVDASRLLGHVVMRKIWASSAVHVYRLTR